MTLPPKLLLAGGTLVLPQGAPRPADLLIVDGQIAAIDPGAVDADIARRDVTGLMVAPALIDLGVFAVEPQACAAGGIVRVAPMPDGPSPTDSPALIQRSALAAKPALWVHPLAAATRGLAGRELADFALMKAAGARGVATGRRWIANSGVMRRVMQSAAALDLCVIAHAEDDGLAHGAVATEGLMATLLGLACAPALAEGMAVARDLMLAEATGARLHFRQITTAPALNLIRAARARGVAVSCGITPAHWLLNDTALGAYRTFTRLSPPLRDERDRLACLAGLADGTITVIGSGHDPRPPEAKRLPFAEADSGMSGADTLLALGLGLVRDQILDLPALFDRLAAQPAALLGLEGGGIVPGAPADLIVFDANRPWIAGAQTFQSAASNTPFEAMGLQGQVDLTLKGGRPTFVRT